MKNCRTCTYWLRHSSDDELLKTIPEKFGHLERVCKKMTENAVTITTSDGGLGNGSSVDSVETDANFGCVLHEYLPLIITPTNPTPTTICTTKLQTPT